MTNSETAFEAPEIRYLKVEESVSGNAREIR
jgi:hypothetical protein